MHGSELRMQIDGDKMTERYWVLAFYNFSSDSSQHQSTLRHKTTMILDSYMTFIHTLVLAMHIQCIYTCP